MTGPRLPLDGGPFDGSSIASRPDPFVFVYGRRDAPRGSSAPRAGRAIYERHGDRLVDATGHYAVCCGGIHHRSVSCICGSGRVAESKSVC